MSFLFPQEVGSLSGKCFRQELCGLLGWMRPWDSQQDSPTRTGNGSNANFSVGRLFTETNLKKIVMSVNINLAEKSLRGPAVTAMHGKAITWIFQASFEAMGKILITNQSMKQYILFDSIMNRLAVTGNLLRCKRWPQMYCDSLVS